MITENINTLNAKEDDIKTKKVEQPPFEVMDLTLYKPKYHKDGTLVWKRMLTKKGRPTKKKVYPKIYMDNVRVKKDFIVREDILRQSEEQLSRIGELIPILLSPSGVLLNGYEQYLIAKKRKWKKIPFYPQKQSAGQKRARHKMKQNKKGAKIKR